MCGIVGYIGQNDTKEVLLNGLEKLEYRGYDSAGIAMLNAEGINLTKVKGRIAALRERVDNSLAQLGACNTGRVKYPSDILEVTGSNPVCSIW